MKLIVQRVSGARVVKKETAEVVGEIETGLFALVGFKKGDTENEVEKLADKLFRLRVMNDDSFKMNRTVNEVGGKFIIVSQFTLYADTTGGNRPSFVQAEDPSRARELYELFINSLRSLGATVETGSFGDYMEISADLDGPVTIILES